MTTENALTLPERAFVALGSKDYELKIAAAQIADNERIAAERRAADERLLAAERAEQAATEAARRADAEKTGTIRRFIDEHLDLMTDEQLLGVLQFCADLTTEPQPESNNDRAARERKVYGPIFKAAISLLAACDDRHNSDAPLKYTIPYGALNALRASLHGVDLAPQPAIPDGWQSIDTAPKDGRIVLLYRPTAYEWGKVTPGKWDDNKYAKRPRPYWDMWFKIGSITDSRSWGQTHWMPMPDAPEPRT